MKFPSFKQSRAPDIISVMGRLLSDQVLREDFCNAPRRVAQQLGLVGSELELVALLDPVGLKNQAEALLQKRWHEVAKLLPITITVLGDDAEEIFRYYAVHAWPTGHRRHVLDAAEFVRFLEHNQIVKVDSTEKRRSLLR